MFVHTNEVLSVLINIDSLIKIDGIRQTTTRSLTKITENSSLTIPPEIYHALKFLNRRYQCAFISAYSPKTGALIRAKLRDYMDFTPWVSRQETAFNSSVRLQIKKAIHKAQFTPCNTVYFCGDPVSLEDAHKAQLGTVCWYDRGQDPAAIHEIGPDFVVYSAFMFEHVFNKNLLGYFSEVKASPKDLISKQRRFDYYDFISLANDERAGEFIYVGGRYFATKDSRYQKHALSIRIINSKDHIDRQLDNFAEILAGMIYRIAYTTKSKPNLITRIPPKPGQNDRLGKQLAVIPTKNHDRKKLIVPRSLIAPNLLLCRRDFPSQKSVGFTDRRTNVRGVFTVGQKVAGKTIFVVDDVVTTGSTLKEACRVLYAAGASRVIPLAMAYHPKTIVTDGPGLYCKICKGRIVARAPKDGGDLFHGCSSFAKNGCKVAISFAKGVESINKAIKISTVG